jgi:hypothetical protein
MTGGTDQRERCDDEQETDSAIHGGLKSVELRELYATTALGSSVREMRSGSPS